ncbi:MAG: divergent polysaccharide deacetylase family protein [Vulcanimicrobiaceae bacterium]
MRTWISLAIIAFALTAMFGGYMSGRASLAAAVPVAASPPPPILSETPLRGVRVARSDEVADDEFASDPVIASDAASSERAGDDAHLAIVIVGCGRSLALEAQFVTLPAALTIVVDPTEPQARDLAQLAATNEKTVYAQVDVLPTAARLRVLRSVFPSLHGIAARLDGTIEPRTFARALHGTGLRFFDEYGDAGARAIFAREAVGYAARSATIDDHLAPGYVRFMLDQSVAFARGGPTATILARPRPATYGALRDFLMRSGRDGVALVPLAQS